MLHSLFYMKTTLHVSGGTSTYHEEHKQLYLQHLVFVTPLLLPGLSVLWVVYTPLTAHWFECAVGGLYTTHSTLV